MKKRKRKNGDRGEKRRREERRGHSPILKWFLIGYLLIPI